MGTIQKLYSLPQWNVIYDLNGDKFFEDSGLSAHCADKLNSEWFISPAKDADEEKEVVGGEGNKLNAKEVGLIQFGGMGALYQMMAMFGLVFCLRIVIGCERETNKEIAVGR